jgi:membrane protein YqaA with SNARE-associated domain
VGVVLFAETGLLIGFFLPGDSLLFTAGLLCTGAADRGLKLSLAPLLVAAAIGALAGAQCGYLLGRRAGGALLARSRSARLHEGAERAEELLERYGYAKAIVLARFVPVVRTVLNPMAGALGVPVRTFTLWQVTGGLVWSLSFPRCIQHETDLQRPVPARPPVAGVPPRTGDWCGERPSAMSEPQLASTLGDKDPRRSETCQDRTVPTPPIAPSEIGPFHPLSHGQRQTPDGVSSTSVHRLSTGALRTSPPHSPRTSKRPGQRLRSPTPTQKPHL